MASLGAPGQTRYVVAAVVAVLLLLAASCSGGSDTEDAEADSEGSGSSESAAEGPDESEAPDQDAQPSESDGPAVPSAGCTTPGAAATVKGRQTVSLETEDGEEHRWYLLTAPEAATGSDPVPLVLDFHGLSEGAEFHSNSTGWSELAEQEGFAVAFPHGSGRTVAWDIRSSGPNPDLDYVDAVLESIEQQYCIDTSRVYATGLSNGAFLSSVIACTRSDVFAAVAPVAGVVFPPDCAPVGPVPVLAFHGTADPLLPFNGSVSADALAGLTSGTGVTTTTSPPGDLDGAGYPAGAAAWAESNGCGDPVDERITESVVRRSWECPAHGEVVFYMIEDGGHTWPGSDALTGEGIEAIVGSTTMEIDATELSWEFFRSRRLLV